MELKDRIVRNLEWSNKRLKLIDKGLDEEQMEIIEFSLLHDLLQFSITDVVASSKSLFQKGDKVIVCDNLKAQVLEVIRPNLLKIQYENGNAISNEFTQFIKHQKDL